MSKPKLYDFQEEDVRRIEQWGGRCVLGLEQGLGKTVIALEYIDRNPRSTLPAVIVCPAHLKYNWAKMAQGLYGFKTCVVNGLRADSGRIEGYHLIIVNYDIMHAWQFALMAIKPKLLVADECQALASSEARRTISVGNVVKSVPQFLALSGTPITNRPIEFWSVLNMIDKKSWPNRYSYGHRYCGPKRNFFTGGWEFKGASNTKELHERLTGTLLIRRRKEDVLKDLPPRMDNSVVIELTAKQQKEYKQAKEGLRDWLRVNYNPAAGKKSGRVEAAQRVNSLRQMTADLKLPHSVEWVKTFLESGEKLIAFAWHRRVVQAVKDAFKDCCVAVNGDTPAKERQDAYERFNNDPACTLFVGNFQAAGTGWSSTACSNVAALELPWRPADVDQAVDRCRGICRGVKGVPTSAWFHLAEGTQDARTLEILAEKQKNLSAVLDGKDGVEGNVFDAVIEWLLR